MIARLSAAAGVIAVIGCFALGRVGAASSESGGLRSRVPAHIVSRTPRFLPRAAGFAGPIARQAAPVSRAEASVDFATESLVGDDRLPLWKYTLRSPRDGHSYSGLVLGRDPFDKPATSRIGSQIIPLIVRTHRIATGIDPTTLEFTTAPGDTTIDPTVSDNTCMTAPNNVPLTVVRQSPIFTPTPFAAGGTTVGTTQYVDAYLRSSYWNALGSKAADYHTLLDPIHVLDPIVVDVPPNVGIAVTDPNVFAALGFSVCAPVQMIDWYWFDSYLRSTLFPELPTVNPATFPVFVAHNTTWTYGVDNLFNCCLPAWSSIAGYPIATQTFAVGSLDRSKLFAPTGLDVEFLTVAIGDWAADPYFSDVTPPWGNTPTWTGCVAAAVLPATALEGIALPPPATANGFAYHLQEAAFPQWFFGVPSTGVNGWFSSGGTLLSDAGRVCP